MSARLAIGIIGCGLIGRRRATEAAANPRTRCVVVASRGGASARSVASTCGADATDNWRRVVERQDVDAVVVATPNAYLAEIAVAALEAGKHVLVEKPMGCNVGEAEQMSAAARAASRVLKVGFNHRYHPAISEARRRVVDGRIGDLINIRCRFGHGGRPGYEREWRGSRALAGGGELLDLGVHVVDLIHWFAGVPRQAFGFLQTAVWPIGDLEDNAFGIFRFDSALIAAFHTSWTQWKNLFSFEVFGCEGALIVEGLGGSYGVETLTAHRRRPEGGPPVTETMSFERQDPSCWKLEWEDFLGGVIDGRPMLGGADEGVVAMRMLRALYQSAETGVPVDV